MMTLKDLIRPPTQKKAIPQRLGNAALALCVVIVLGILGLILWAVGMGVNGGDWTTSVTVGNSG